MDAFDDTPEYVKEMAIRAVEAIPGVECAGVDFLYDKEKDEAVIIEVNGNFWIASSVFPQAGEARDTPAAVIDHMFPETRGSKRSLLYFDYEKISAAFIHGGASFVKMPQINPQKEASNRFFLDGRFGKKALRDIRKTALKCGVSGYARKVDNKTLEITVRGNRRMIRHLKKLYKKDYPLNSAKERIREVIPLGFKTLPKEEI